MTKPMKGLLVAMMTVAMAFALAAVPFAAYAADTYDVTISKDQANEDVTGRTFSAYKLFNAEAVTKDNKTSYKYDYASAEAKTAVINAYNSLDGVTKLDANAGASDVAKAISELNASQSIKFAKAINTTNLTKAGSGSSFKLENGYYVVTEDTATPDIVKAAPFVIQVDGATKQVTLKSQQPDVDKIITDGKGDKKKYGDYQNGEAVPFQIQTEVPNTYGYSSYIFNIEDKMSSGLTVSKEQLQALEVKIAGTAVAAKDYTVYVVDGNKNKTKVSDLDPGWSQAGVSFEVDFDINKFIGKYTTGDPVSYTQDPAAGSEITVDFNATLNDDAVVKTAETNTTHIVYSNNPKSDGTGESEDHTVYVYTFGVDLLKTFSGATPTQDDYNTVRFSMTGAKAGTKLTEISAGVYKVDPNGTIDPTADDALRLHPDNHNITIKGLDEGTYTFTETTIPDGWSPEGAKTITITAQYSGDGDGNQAPTVKVTEDTNNDGYADGKVNNTPKTFKLPQTGDWGFIIMPLLGLAIMLAVAGVAFSSRMRKKNSSK